jgi:tetratricopeptide (TPR) repeat protein
MTVAGNAKGVLGNFEEAVAWFRRAIEINRNYTVTYFPLAATLAQLDRLDEAHSAVKAGLALNPAFSISRARVDWTSRSNDPTYLAWIESLLESLRNAGLPEE